MKPPKNNTLEEWLLNYQRKHPIKSRWIELKIKFRILFINILNKQDGRKYF